MAPSATPTTSRRDDAAYMAPLGVFLLCTWVGGQFPSLFVLSYVLKTVLAAAALIYFRSYYRAISFRGWHLGVILGIIGILQWCGVEETLLRIWENYPRLGGRTEPLNPWTHFAHPWQAWAFIILRWAGATLVVPFMEELFWRDYLWRTVLAPNDFRLASIGEWHWQPALVSLALFTSVHPQWITAIIWGALITILLVWKKSLGACIVMHGVTNFLLGAYTLYTGKWYYW